MANCICGECSPDYISKSLEELSKTAKEILCITTSSKLSGVYNAAVIASKQVNEKSPETEIRVFDSMNAAGGEGLIVLAAAKAAAIGLSLNEVTAVAEKARQNSECLFVFDTLRHAYRTGRVPRAVSQAADILKVRPMCRLYRDGKVHIIGLTRSRKKGVEKIIEIARGRVGDSPICAMVMHTAALTDAEKLCERVQREFNCRDIFISEFSPVMGYGTGPGVLGIAICPEISQDCSSCSATTSSD